VAVVVVKAINCGGGGGGENNKLWGW